MVAFSTKKKQKNKILFCTELKRSDNGKLARGQGEEVKRSNYL